LGISKGRPIGGITVFVRKSFSNLVSVVGSDDDNRIICVMFACRDLDLLSFGSYFSCCDSSSLYMDNLLKILGYIESIIDMYAGCKVNILGDLSFECSTAYCGYRIFDDFAASLGLMSCDDMVPACSFTYLHASFNQKSFLNHLFISRVLKNCIHNFYVKEEGFNTSDHFPICFDISVSLVSSATSDEVTKIQEYKWDKKDPYYYYCSGDLLKSIFHSFACCANSTLCNNSSHELDIKIYYSEIIHALTIAADGTIPKVAKSALKHYWSAALTDLKQKSEETYDLWVLCGRPRNGFMYELMKSAKYKYKLAIHDAVKSFKNRFSDKLYEHLLSKDLNGFWRMWFAKTSKKILSVSNVDGKTSSRDIAGTFKTKFDLQSCTGNAAMGLDSMFNSNCIIDNWLFTVKDVDYVLHHHIKSGKAAGIDNLTAEHLFYYHPSITVHLSNLFNLMLKHSYVPSQFGLGIIVPLVNDKNGNVCSSDNYKGITTSPLISKVFEYCLMLKFENFLYSSDLQMGFTKKLGCGFPLFALQEMSDYFVFRSSSIFITAINASKAFDRVNHKTLVNKLCSRQAPPCFVGLIINWYSKVYSCVRWNGILVIFFGYHVVYVRVVSCHPFCLTCMLMTCLCYCISLITDVMFLKRSLGASCMLMI